jgi:hypothetical protein
MLARRKRGEVRALWEAYFIQCFSPYFKMGTVHTYVRNIQVDTLDPHRQKQKQNRSDGREIALSENIRTVTENYSSVGSNAV